MKKVLEQNKTFMRAHRKSGDLDLTEEEIRAEAHKRQKEMGDAARAAEMTKEEVDRKSTRLNSSHMVQSRMPSSA